MKRQYRASLGYLAPPHFSPVVLGPTSPMPPTSLDIKFLLPLLLVISSGEAYAEDELLSSSLGRFAASMEELETFR